MDERSAGYFALGAAQATGRPAAVLCTSGTAAANLHPAVCEADEAGVPLIVLTADRPPELRGIGAGQTIDQLKLYGGAVRWFCEVGTHEADDAGLLHFRSVACRAYAAARGEPRPGPVHLNLAWRDPLGPEPRAEDVTATSRARAGGPRRAPADRGRLRAAGGRRGADRRARRAVVGCAARPDRRRPPAGRRARRAGGRAGRARRLPDPRRADLAAAARATTTGSRRVALRRDRARWPRRARARARGPVRRHADEQGASPVAGSLAGAPPNRRRPGLRLERAHASGRDDRASRAALAGGGPGRAARGAARTSGGSPGSRRRGQRPGRSRPSFGSSRSRPSPARTPRWPGCTETGSSSTPRRRCRFATRRRSCPRAATEVRFLCNRGANGIDGLISSGIGAAAASGRPTWIVTGDLGLYHDMNGLAALAGASAPVRIVVLNNGGGGIFEFLPQAEQLDRARVRSPARNSRGARPGRGRGALRTAPRAGRAAGSARTRPRHGGTAVIEIRSDRRAERRPSPADRRARRRGPRRARRGR